MPWTAEEELLLREAVRRNNGKNWPKISAAVGTRNVAQCRDRWQRISDLYRKGTWTKAEDDKLREAHARCTAEQLPKAGLWTRIANVVGTRSNRQCRERWFHHLSDTVVKAKWSEDEDRHLLELIAKNGHKWATISRMMPGRSDNDVKNRFNSRNRPSRAAARATAPACKSASRARKPRVRAAASRPASRPASKPASPKTPTLKASPVRPPPRKRKTSRPDAAAVPEAPRPVELFQLTAAAESEAAAAEAAAAEPEPETAAEPEPETAAESEPETAAEPEPETAAELVPRLPTTSIPFDTDLLSFSALPYFALARRYES